MKPTEAERLLGGYATGILSPAERRTLFTAALERQDLFDALVDEEALRELLADPTAKAQLLVALSSTRALKTVPFWRRPGLVSAAAGLIVAATAGLAYLRSPDKAPPLLPQGSAKPPQAGAAPATPASRPPGPAARTNAAAAPGGETARPSPVGKAPAHPVPSPQRFAAPPAAGASALAGAPNVAGSAEFPKAEAQDEVAKKAGAPRPAAALMEAAGSILPARASERAKALQRDGAKAGMGSDLPVWTLDPLPEGGLRVTVLAPQGRQVVLLKRSVGGVGVPKLLSVDGPKDGPVRWFGDVPMAAGDTLDLYVLNHPVADPATLPETGAVDGFRARIHPAGKPDPSP